MLELSSGGDMRCFILDNRRPFHLANVHSNFNVVLLDDGFTGADEEEDIPSDGSELDAPHQNDLESDSNSEADDFEEVDGEYVSSNEDKDEIKVKPKIPPTKLT